MFPPPLGYLGSLKLLYKGLILKQTPILSRRSRPYSNPGLPLAAAVLAFSIRNPQSPLLGLTFSGGRSLIAVAVAQGFSAGARVFSSLASRETRKGRFFILSFQAGLEKHG